MSEIVEKTITGAWGGGEIDSVCLPRTGNWQQNGMSWPVKDLLEPSIQRPKVGTIGYFYNLEIACK
ncbi:unnamed protein product [marine sediment metagenome]|uniref:Uncharacterized protein n=1 Tax=marine sediment metagenome TaxID=412755 RepID=X1SBA7_9ZZZZ